MLSRLTRLVAFVAVLMVSLTGAAAAAARPANDNRDSAAPLKTLPITVSGTTVGATVEANEPGSGCDADTAGSVWYSLAVGKTAPGRIAVAVSAKGDLDAAVDVYVRQRSQNIRVTCQLTNKKGDAGFTFTPTAKTTYLIRVAQLSNSSAGRFTLDAFVAPPPPTPPGIRLSGRGASGVLDGLFKGQTAYSMRLRAGQTYKVNLVNREMGCLSLGIFAPGTGSFDGDPVARLGCAGYRLFTPSVSGLWSFLITADSTTGTQRYALHVAPASHRDTAPGIFLRNFASYHGLLRGNVIDDVRLFRFDVTSRSNLQLTLTDNGNEPFDLRLLDNDGRTLDCECDDTGKLTIDRVTKPGRYFAEVQAEHFGSGRFTLSRQSRLITSIHVDFDGLRYQRLAPRSSTRLTAGIRPSINGPVTFEIEYFDPVVGWQFHAYDHAYATDGVAEVSFAPPKVGRWRAMAVFRGTKAASSSASRFANLLVAGPLTQ